MNDRTRLALIVAAVALVLAAPVVLIALRADSGSAAFGDVEQVGRNRLSAATLDIEVGSRTAPIGVTDLAPGDLAAGQVEFRNAGTLPLRYVLEASVSTPRIADDLTWWFRFSDDVTCPSETGWRAGSASDVEVAGRDLVAGVTLASPAGRRLDIGERHIVCLAVELDIEASNDAQATTVGLELIARAEQIAEPLDDEPTRDVQP